MGHLAKYALVAFAVSVLLMGRPGASLAQQSATSSNQAALYQYGTPGIQLQGTLIEREAFGPPGYGKTSARDQRMKVLVLRLSRPISVEPSVSVSASSTANMAPATNILDVQLYIDPSRRADAQTLVGHAVTVTGTLKSPPPQVST